VDGFQRRHKNHINELLYLAWHTEAFARQKKLPSLDSLLQKNENESGQQRQQTDEEMMNMCKLLNAAFGGEVVEV